MNDFLMIEAYQLDQAYNTYDVLDSIYDPVTQADMDEAQGFDDYGDYLAGDIAAPKQPHNPAYMKGWMKRDHDFFRYDSWDKFCL